MHSQLALDLLLGLICGLQAVALAVHLAGKRGVALWLAGSNCSLVLGAILLFFTALAKAQPWHYLGVVELAFVGLEAAAVVAATVGLARRTTSGWLFWPVWGWNFAIVAALIYGKLALAAFA